MADRLTLLETALDFMPEAVAVFGGTGEIVLWNTAAEAITGYSASELHGGSLPAGLNQLLSENTQQVLQRASRDEETENLSIQVRIRHQLGHDVLIISRTLILRNSLGEAIGATVLFHPAERLGSLPHGDLGDDQALSICQAEFEERLYSEFEDFERGTQPLGIIWIRIDQGYELSQTHGVAACRSMLEKVQHAVISGLRPGQELGRWGEDEFLILAHERTSEMLNRHAGILVGLARTADFRWWGDRVSLTVSIGAVQAVRGRPLAALIESAKKAMEESMRRGGNRLTCSTCENTGDTEAGEEQICTPS